MKRAARLVAAVVVCVGTLVACGGSSAKHVAAGTKSEDTTTTQAADTSTSDSATVARATSTTRAVPTGSTGVRGVVTAGPTCPVQRQGDPSCDDKPVPAHLVLQRGDGSSAASGDAGSDGQFFIAASAGSYTLTASSPNAMRCSSQPVTATSGHVTDVHVSCDTGIR